MKAFARITLAAGLSVVVMGSALALLPSLNRDAMPAGVSVQEGRSIVISGKIEYLMEESKGKVGVAVTPYAQLFFVIRSDQNFEKWLNLLKEARAHNQGVKLTVREYSGRIEHVTVQK